MTSRLSAFVEPYTVIGFNGRQRNGLQIHKTDENYIFSFGRTLAIKNLNHNSKTTLLHGHNHDISTIQISHDGKYIATGEKTNTGFKTFVNVWEYGTEKLYGNHDLHKANVEAISFTSDDKYVISLGGDEFEKGVLVWSMEIQEVLCGCQASQGIEGIAHCLASANTISNMFVTAGERTIRVWELHKENRQITNDCISTGHLKRDIRVLKIDKDDLYFYGGTTSGDIVKIRLDLANHKAANWIPIFVCDLTKLIGSRTRTINAYFSSGVTALDFTPREEELIIGTGNGMLYLMEQIVTKRNDKIKMNKTVSEIKLSRIREVQLKGIITSIIFHEISNDIYVGSDYGVISKVNYLTFTIKDILTAHKYSVTDITFPSFSSDIFVTSSKEEIRIWGLDPVDLEKILLIRSISFPQAICSSVHCMANGGSIISGWSDGTIRIFGPESGKLLYSITDSHRSTKIANEDTTNDGVTVVTGTSNSKLIISGGGDGQIRVWNATGKKQELIASMKEHKGPVCCVRIHSSDLECVSASLDGTSIIWDLKRFARKQVVFASTIFRTVCYGLEECQLLTGGTDNNVSYWEVHNGALIRHIKAGARTESIQAIDLIPAGGQIVSGSSDGLLRIWLYHKGTLELIGKGHGASITKVRVSPDNQSVISVAKDGSIIRWKLHQN